MSELKELAFAAAARGSPAGIVLVVFLIVGGIVQHQAPPSAPDQNLFVETRVVCPSLLSETRAEETFPRALALKSGADSNRSVSMATDGAFDLSEFSVPLLSSLLQLVPVAGLAKQGYEEFKSGKRPVNTPWLCLAMGNSEPLIRFSVVHLLGQAGTFGASQLARFASTRPGYKFFDHCGKDSASFACRRSVRENLRVLKLIPDLELVLANQTDSSPETALPNLKRAAPQPNATLNSDSLVSSPLLSSHAEYDNAEFDEGAEFPAVLCQNTAYSFSDLFKNLHENPKFSSGSFGAAAVSLLFGLRLLSRVGRRRRNSALAPDDEQPRGSSPRAACLWTLAEALAFLIASVSAVVLLVHFYSRETNSGSDLLLGVSLGVSVQLCAVLWSTYGNLFFDLRRLRDLAWSSAATSAPEPTAVQLAAMPTSQ